MTNYTVRVELHGVRHDSEKYEELHEQMAERGLKRTLSIDGVTWELPPAEYSKVSEEEVSQMMTDVKAAAIAVVGSERKFSVLITASKVPRAHHNLMRK